MNFEIVFGIPIKVNVNLYPLEMPSFLLPLAHCSEVIIKCIYTI